MTDAHIGYVTHILAEERKRLVAQNDAITSTLAAVEALWGPAGKEDLLRTRRPPSEWVSSNLERIAAIDAAVDVLEAR